MVQAQLISSASFLPDVLFRRGSLLAPFRLPSILETSIVGNIVVAFSSSLPSPPRDRKNETREKPLRSGRRITRNEKKSLFLLAIFNFKFSMRLHGLKQSIVSRIVEKVKVWSEEERYRQEMKKGGERG